MKTSARYRQIAHRHVVYAVTGVLLAHTSLALAADISPSPAAAGAKFAIAPIIGSLLSSLLSNSLQRMANPQAAPANAGGYQQLSNYSQFEPSGQPNYPAQTYQQQAYQPQGYPQQSAYPAVAQQQAYAAQANAPCYFSQSGNGIAQALISQLLQAGCQAMTQTVAVPQQQLGQYVAPVMQPGYEQPQLSYYKSGAPNYQGVKVTVVMTDQAGRVIGERPVGDAFFSGERFRLKIQPTFSGLLEIDHIGPSGARTQLFPKAGMSAFLVTAGSEVTLPLGDAVYEFDSERGNEQLAFKVRDPRINNANQYGGFMLAQDVGQSTFLGQQVAEDGQLPYISQLIEIQHR